MTGKDAATGLGWPESSDPRPSDDIPGEPTQSGLGWPVAGDGLEPSEAQGAS